MQEYTVITLSTLTMILSRTGILKHFAILIFMLALTGVVSTRAQAQIVPPDNAERVLAVFNGSSNVTVVNQILRIAVGRRVHPMAASIQIRNMNNLIVLPSHVRGTFRARVLFDGSGNVTRVWLVQQMPDA